MKIDLFLEAAIYVSVLALMASGGVWRPLVLQPAIRPGGLVVPGVVQVFPGSPGGHFREG
jgi:hypothetical protein